MTNLETTPAPLGLDEEMPEELWGLSNGETWVGTEDYFVAVFRNWDDAKGYRDYILGTEAINGGGPDDMLPRPTTEAFHRNRPVVNGLAFCDSHGNEIMRRYFR